jgi:hypothetical protein
MKALETAMAVHSRQLGHQQTLERAHQLSYTLPVQVLWPSEEHWRQQWPKAGGGQVTAGPSTAIYLCKGCGPMKSTRDSNGPEIGVDS